MRKIDIHSEFHYKLPEPLFCLVKWNIPAYLDLECSWTGNRLVDESVGSPREWYLHFGDGSRKYSL